MNTKLFAFLFIGMIAFSSCKLNRPSVPALFPGKVTPTVACPGQNIKIEWDAEYVNGDCKSKAAACKRDPLTVEIAGTVGASFKLSPAPLSGEQNTVITGNEDVTISMHAFDTDQDLGTATIKINVLSRNEMLNFDALCEGICLGDIAAWKEMAVDFKDQSISDLIALKQLKNTNAFDIELKIYYQNGETATVDLKAGATSSLFNSRVAKVAAKIKAEVNACKGSEPPVSIKLQTSYGCL